MSEYEAALRINPNDTEALNNASWVLATSRDASTVMAHARCSWLNEPTAFLMAAVR